MKLYERNLKACVLLEAEDSDDGEGGRIISYVNGDAFFAAIILESSVERLIGENTYTLGKYSVVTPYDDENKLRLSFGKRFKTVDDGRTFIVTSEPVSPPSGRWLYDKSGFDS